MDDFLRRIASHEDVTSPWKRRNAQSSIKSARRFLALAMWTSRKLIKGRPLSGGRAPFRDVTVDMTYRHAANSLITHDQISRWQDVAGWWKADKLDEQAEKRGFYVGSILRDRYVFDGSILQSMIHFLKIIYKFLSSRFFYPFQYIIKCIKRN